MVDTKTQYHNIKKEVDEAVLGVLESSVFIGGKVLDGFVSNLAKYNGSKHCIPCANGTDALQIAMMALGLKAGDEMKLGIAGLGEQHQKVHAWDPALIDNYPDVYLSTGLVAENHAREAGISRAEQDAFDRLLRRPAHPQ